MASTLHTLAAFSAIMLLWPIIIVMIIAGYLIYKKEKNASMFMDSIGFETLFYVLKNLIWNKYPNDKTITILIWLLRIMLPLFIMLLLIQKL